MANLPVPDDASRVCFSDLRIHFFASMSLILDLSMNPIAAEGSARRRELLRLLTHCGALDGIGPLAVRPEDPRWLLVDVQVERKTRVLGCRRSVRFLLWPPWSCCAKGNRLSTTPVDAAHWKLIVEKIVK